MAAADLVVAFPDHMPSSQIDSLVTSIAACGNVAEAEQPHTYTVSVFRPSKPSRLEEQLVVWERYGFLRWHRAV